MKRTNLMHRGNVTGTGHGNRWPGATLVADIPRNAPLPRRFRRIVRTYGRTPQPVWPKWAVMPPLLDWMFRKAGLMVTPE